VGGSIDLDIPPQAGCSRGVKLVARRASSLGSTNNGGRSLVGSTDAGCSTSAIDNKPYLCGVPAGCVTRIVFANRNDGYLFGPDPVHHHRRRADLAPVKAESRPWAPRHTSTQGFALATHVCQLVAGPCGLTLQQQADRDNELGDGFAAILPMVLASSVGPARDRSVLGIGVKALIRLYAKYRRWKVGCRR